MSSTTEGASPSGDLGDPRRRGPTGPSGAPIEALRANDQQFQVLLANSKDLIGVVALDGTILWMSEVVTEMLGYDVDEVVGLSAFDLIHPDDLDETVVRFGRVIDESDEPGPLTLRVRCRDGCWLDVEGLGNVLKDDDGAPEAILINVRDVSSRVAAEAALRASEARYRTVVSSSYDVTAVVDRDGVVKWVTPNAERLLGWSPAEIEGTNGLDLIHPDDLEFILTELSAFVAGDGVPNPTPIRMRHQDGRWCDVEMVATDFLDHPDIDGIAVNLRDVTDRIAAERARARLTDIFELTSDIVGIAHADGPLVYINEAARRYFGVPGDRDVSEVRLVDVFPDDALRRLADEAFPAIEATGIWSGEIEVRTADGATVPVLAQLLGHRDAAGRPEYLSGVLRDITERKQFERQLEHQATHDPLTGLPNRTLLLDRLGVALAHSRRRRAGLAVLFCDLDHFKVVNDSLGHSFGDRVLVEVAQRLTDHLRPGDTVSRFGGDEFVILCEDLDGVDDAVAIAERAERAVEQPVELEGQDVFVGLSIGIALVDPTGGELPAPDDLVRDADAAMYRAKARGRGRYQVFETGMWEQAVDRFSLEHRLRQATSRDELVVEYQPVFSLVPPGGTADVHGDGGGRRVIGVEALVRWDHPERGRLLPEEFMAVAEETGVVVAIGERVLEEACHQLRSWTDAVPAAADLTVAVNLSGRQLGDPELVRRVAAALHRSGVEPHRLQLEITESVLMDDVTVSAQILRELRDLGVRVAVDDFGTGYSSLTYLRRLPVDTLKVDRSFVDGLGCEPEDSAIVAAVVNLAHTLGMQAVAEGVESTEQLAELERLGCDHAQGFLLAPPVDGAGIGALLGG